MKGIAILTSVRKQSLAGADALEHVGGASSVVGLAFTQFQPDRVAVTSPDEEVAAFCDPLF